MEARRVLNFSTWFKNTASAEIFMIYCTGEMYFQWKNMILAVITLHSIV